jgi:hypothetical protein
LAFVIRHLKCIGHSFVYRSLVGSFWCKFTSGAGEKWLLAQCQTYENLLRFRSCPIGQPYRRPLSNTFLNPGTAGSPALSPADPERFRA